MQKTELLVRAAAIVAILTQQRLSKNDRALALKNATEILVGITEAKNGA